jgi:hypothetical protein
LGGIKCGFLGALIYLAKYFGFPFFLAHYLLFNLIHLCRCRTKESRRIVLINLFSGITIFLLISGSWIYLLSQKYNHFTFSTTGRYTLALTAPNSKGSPMHYAGILKPVNDSAVSVWEDPSYLVLPEYKPFHSFSNIKHFLYNFLKNLIKVYNMCLNFSPFSIAVFVVAILFIKIDNSLFDNKIFYALVTCFIYIFGYAIILVDYRYLYPVFVLITLIQILIINESYLHIKNKSNIISILFFISIILISAYRPMKQVSKSINVNKNVHIISNIIQKEIPSGSNVASNKEWGETLYISYLNGYKYYGETKVENLNDQLILDLNKNNITYYFEWKNDIPKNEDYKIKYTEKLIKIFNKEKVILDIIHVK